MWEPLISKWLNLTLYFKGSISDGCFKLRHCEHAELKWFRVLSSSGLSYRRCWIIKCGFYYIRRLVGEFCELVIARTKCLLFYIQDARVCSCTFTYHSVTDLCQYTYCNILVLPSPKPRWSLLTCFISQSSCPSRLHTHVHKQAAWCLGSMRLAATMHKN